MKKKKDQEYKGILNTYIRWPLYLSGMMVAMLLSTYIYREQALIIISAFTAMYCIVALVIYHINKSELQMSLMDYATNYGVVQKELLKAFDIPYAIFDETGHVIWNNKAFDELFHVEGLFRWSIVNENTGITREKLPPDSESVEYTFTWEGRDLRCRARRISMVYEQNALLDPDKFDGSVISMVVYDETELNNYIRINRENSLVAGYIYLERYDNKQQFEASNEASLNAAFVERTINRYVTTKGEGIIKKIDVDKFFVVMKRKGLETMIEDKFSLLETIRDQTIKLKSSYGDNVIMTASIGFGAGSGEFQESANYASIAINQALSRGGDQAVVKDGERISYFGGNSEQTETNSRVKARRQAQTLSEHIHNYEKIMVMGHAIGDQDAFGSDVGIRSAAKYLGKECYIVLNEVTTSIRPMLNDYLNEKGNDEGVIIDSSQALELFNPETMLLIVVDTNKPDLCECPRLLEMSRATIVIDHHRQGTEKIENTIMQYIESNASSACEMISEILQYLGDNFRLKGCEADCLYAGIMIDSGNFTTKTSARTFEAAAFLRKNGADVTRIRKLFRDSMDSYKARAEAVRNAELYCDSFAIAVCPAEGLESPTVVGAQAANELMNIRGVKAAFVLTDYQERIYISARSIDEVNVQRIMERMGGGGHLNIAGVQLKGFSIENAREELKRTIDLMIDKGEI